MSTATLSTITLTIEAEHPALVGHFPDAPIVPGVLLLDEMVRAAQRQPLSMPWRWRIATAKFLKPVRPGELLTIEQEMLPNGSLRFCVARGGEPVAQGVFTPADAPARPYDGREAG
jgi:3-hydroxyacyl-[acyl-carrier-protein] dehydratase